MANILRVIESLNPSKGGPAYSVSESSKLLVQRGHTVTVVTLDHKDSDFVKTPSFYYVKLGPGLMKYGFSLELIRWLRNNGEKFDFSCIHGIWQWPSLAFRLIKGRTWKYVVMPHGSLDVWDRKFRTKNFLLKKLYWRLFESPLYAAAAACLFTSRVELISAQEQFGPLHGNTEIIPYGAMPVGAVRIATQIGDSSTIGYLGRLHPKKGIDLLLEAFSRVNFGAVNSKLLIAGSGDKMYEHQLRQLSDQLGISSRVYWLGELKGDDKANMLASLGLFVLPSFQENFGLAVAESLSAGTPVLVSKNVNTCDVVQEYAAGIVCEHELESVVDGIQKWVDIYSHKKDIRMCAVNCYTARMSLHAFVDRLEEFAI